MPDVKRGKHLRGLPVNLPTDRKFFCLPLPDDREYEASYLGALYQLGLQSRYDRDATHKAKEVSDIWKAIHREHADIIFADEGCEITIEGDCCESYTPEQDWIAFLPNDPFTTPDYIPDGYLLPPFYHNAAIPLPNTLPTDALLNFLSFPASQSLPELLATGLPRCIINFRGSGQVEVEFVRVPQGGYVWCQLDGSPENDQLVDLNQFSIFSLANIEALLDVILEEKLVQTQLVEFNVETTGNHQLVCYFIPNVGTDVLLGFGGGVRSIEFCDGTSAGEEFIMQMQTIDGDEGCHIIQWRPNSEATWIDLVTVCDGADGAAGADAPPLHMGFDAATCSLKYTQGDISSPYVGGDWNTIFDWNLVDLRECLGIIGESALPAFTGVDYDTCKVAWGIAEFIRNDIRTMYMRHLALGGSTTALSVMGTMLLEGGYWFNWNWYLSLAEVIGEWDTPTSGGLNALNAAATMCRLAEQIYINLTEVDGALSLDTAELYEDTAITLSGDAGVDAAINRFIQKLSYVSSGAKVQEYLSRGTQYTTTKTCADFDCDALVIPTCSVASQYLATLYQAEALTWTPTENTFFHSGPNVTVIEITGSDPLIHKVTLPTTHCIVGMRLNTFRYNGAQGATFGFRLRAVNGDWGLTYSAATTGGSYGNLDVYFDIINTGIGYNVNEFEIEIVNANGAHYALINTIQLWEKLT